MKYKKRVKKLLARQAGYDRLSAQDKTSRTRPGSTRK